MEDEKKALWAPWRIEFIRSEKDGPCFLCNKKNDFNTEEESLIVKRFDRVFVIMNRYPYNSGHIMIAPYVHCAKLEALEKETRHEMIDVAAEAKIIMDKLFRPDAFNAGINLGKAAGAGLEEHIHLHIVPRWNGDTNFMPVFADVRVMPEALEETAKLIRNAWI